MVYTNMYGESKDYPVARTEYDRYWLLADVSKARISVTFEAQWNALTDVTISLINSLTGVSTRYTFDPSVDYTMPEGPAEQILIGDVYYKFDGWYDNAECEGAAVTEIKANTFDINNSKYYSKWSPVIEEVN